jgi:nuclear transport factor 2 (NTF2) superfamily protein
MNMDTEKKTFVLVHGAWHGGWFRAYGNEQWKFDTNGLMRRREGSINDVPIRGSDRSFTG